MCKLCVKGSTNKADVSLLCKMLAVLPPKSFSRQSKSHKHVRLASNDSAEDHFVRFVVLRTTEMDSAPFLLYQHHLNIEASHIEDLKLTGAPTHCYTLHGAGIFSSVL